MSFSGILRVQQLDYPYPSRRFLLCSYSVNSDSDSVLSMLLLNYTLLFTCSSVIKMGRVIRRLHRCVLLEGKIHRQMLACWRAGCCSFPRWLHAHSTDIPAQQDTNKYVGCSPLHTVFSFFLTTRLCNVDSAFVS